VIWLQTLQKEAIPKKAIPVASVSIPVILVEDIKARATRNQYYNMTGHIQRIGSKGFGFIELDSTNERVFFYYRDVANDSVRSLDDLRVGDCVTCDVMPSTARPGTRVARYIYVQTDRLSSQERYHSRSRSRSFSRDPKEEDVRYFSPPRAQKSTKRLTERQLQQVLSGNQSVHNREGLHSQDGEEEGEIKELSIEMY